MSKDLNLLDLNILVKNRDALLLAEVAAWLHDMGKCRDEHIQNSAYDKPDELIYDYKKNYANILHETAFLDLFINLKASVINQEIEPIQFRHLIEKGMPSALDESSEETLLTKVLGRCHAVPHIEKEEAKDKKSFEKEIKQKKEIDKKIQREQEAIIKIGTQAGELEKQGIGDPNKLRNRADSKQKEILELQEESNALLLKIKQVHQSKDYTWISTPFGYEYEKIDNLNSRLESIPFDQVKNRDLIVKSIKENFLHALGETRRPTNEITLEDWSGSVAALYKASLAGLLLGSKIDDPNCLKWCFLSVRLNSEKIWGESSSIPILLARKEWMESELDELKGLLEKTYPLGNEVYRDENGSVFIVPDIIRGHKSQEALKNLIIEKVPYNGEISINPIVQNESWWGQYHDHKNHPEMNEVPPISSIVSENVPYISTKPSEVINWWDGKRCSICTVSHLRPADSKRSFNRNISDYWLDKITGRAKKWKEQQDSTIWIDEVADSNGRICLLVGKLEISGWLKEGGFIESLIVKPRDKDYNEIKKTPSFARMSRVWRTTNLFWKEVETNTLVKYRRDKRIKLFGDFESEKSKNLQTNSSYEVVSEDDIRFTVFYAGNNEFTIIENLDLICRKIKSEYQKSDIKAHELIEEHLRGRKLKVYNPDDKKRDEPLGNLRISDVISEDANYTPVIPILAEPSIFMAIVPADKALDISKVIKKKYETEMGKVRNRLPLTLGLVFAKSHTPISSLMDAGRRMLKNNCTEQKWKVKSIEDKDPCDSGHKFRILKFENGIKWKVPVTMRDGQIQDIWYPYFYIDVKDSKPEEREKSFKGPDGWLVHASEIRERDVLHILLSTFDFEFMDSSSRRFEISYDDDGRRRDKTKLTRPYMLEELDEFDKIWNIVKPEKLNKSQLKKIMYLLETKRTEWPVEDNCLVFKMYVSDVFNNTTWLKKPGKEEFDLIVKAAASGKLKDVIELYMDISKISENEQNENGGF